MQAGLRDQFLTFFYRQLLKDLIIPLDSGDAKVKEGEKEAQGKSLLHQVEKN